MNRTLVKRVGAGTAVLILLVIAGFIGHTVANHPSPAASTTPMQTKTASSQRRVLYWYDPMKPEQHFNHPGLSPMGMQMVPKYAAASGTAKHIVHINPVEVQNLGMQTTVVKVASLADTVQVPGTVAWDQDLAVTVSARTNLTLETLYVRTPFTAVKVGQPLAEILAPEWSAAAAQYFALRDAESATGRSLRAAALQRLYVLGMNAATIHSLHTGSGTITLRAPVAGVVTTLDVQQGQQLGQGSPILTINGLSKVWVNAAIPQAQSSGIVAGTPITATVTARPGETFHGIVEALLPEVSAATRTQQARIVLDNPGHELAPGMFADLRITGMPGAPYPLVPSEAVIATGVHTRVIEALGNGEFKPVLVKTGRSANGMTAILAGLRGGERIVTSGQFLIDSEASLSGALTRMQAGHTPTRGRVSGSAPSGAMPGMKMPASVGATSNVPAPTHVAVKRPGSKAKPGSKMSMPASPSTTGARS